MPYRMLHVFAAIPPSFGAELQAFYRAVAAVNEREAMAQGDLFVPLALPERSADKSLFQAAIDYNIRLCAYYIQAGDAPGFGHEYELAMACRDDAALPMRQVAVVEAGAEFEARVRSLLSGWLESPAVEVARRGADETDREFIRQLIFDLVSDELGMAAWPEAMRAPLLEIQFQARMRAIRDANPEAEEELLTANGEPVGWVVIARRESEIRLVDIAVIARHRGKGFGSARLQDLIREADAARKPLRLSVVGSNRATGLYRRLGFVPTGGDGVRIFMERLPG